MKTMTLCTASFIALASTVLVKSTNGDNSCPMTCFGQTCSFWVDNEYYAFTCSQMEDEYSCDCSNCEYCQNSTDYPTPTPTPHPTFDDSTVLITNSYYGAGAWTSIGGSYSDHTAHEGDQLVFYYTTSHTVQKMADEHAYDRCTTTGNIEVGGSNHGNDIEGSSADNSLAYVITAEDAAKGEIFFACGVSSHCSSGQKVKVLIFALDAYPTQAPTIGGSFVEVALTLGMSGIACEEYDTQGESAVNSAFTDHIDSANAADFSLHVCTDTIGGSEAATRLLSSAVSISTSVAVATTTYGSESNVVSSIASTMSAAVSSGSFTSSVVTYAEVARLTTLTSVSVTSISAVEAASSDTDDLTTAGDEHSNGDDDGSAGDGDGLLGTDVVQDGDNDNAAFERLFIAAAICVGLLIVACCFLVAVVTYNLAQLTNSRNDPKKPIQNATINVVALAEVEVIEHGDASYECTVDLETAKRVSL